MDDFQGSLNDIQQCGVTGEYWGLSQRCWWLSGVWVTARGHVGDWQGNMDDFYCSVVDCQGSMGDCQGVWVTARECKWWRTWVIVMECG